MVAIDVDQYPIEEINIKGVVEHYHVIPQADALSVDALKNYLILRIP